MIKIAICINCWGAVAEAGKLFERGLGLSAGIVGTFNLKAKMTEHFVNGGYLTQNQIDALTAKLQ